jgi:glycosyltransferase involved in cell wall biosynthesis
MSFRVGVLSSHPVQYYAPWFRHLASRFRVEVFFAHRQDARGQAEAGFGVEFDWDTPVLDGYPHRWLKNVAQYPSVSTFGGCDTPEIYDIVRRESFDAFIVFGWNRKSALQAIHACRRARVPVLMRGDSQLGTERSRAKRAAKYFPYRWLLPRLNHLYVGERNRSYLRHYGVPESRLFFVPHFVDNEFFARRCYNSSEVRHRLGIPAGAFVFLFVGKMIPKKRPADFLHAALRVMGSCADVHALLVGDGELRGELQRLAAPFDDRVHFAGFRNQSELPSFYRSANALVLPSDGGETWGLVVNEAAACGVPSVVSGAVGCAPDLIDEGLTGFTYPLGDVSALTERMLSLKELCEGHPALIGASLEKKMSRYSVEGATHGLEQALRAVTGNGRPGARGAA